MGGGPNQFTADEKNGTLFIPYKISYNLLEIHMIYTSYHTRYDVALQDFRALSAL